MSIRIKEIQSYKVDLLRLSMIQDSFPTLNL